MKIEKNSSSRQYMLFTSVFIIYAMLARYLSVTMGYLSEEAVIRAGQFSDMVIKNPNVRQSIVGSVWFPPLPALIRAPFALLPFHVSPFFLNNIISAASGAGTVLLFNSFICDYRWGRFTHIMLLLLIIFNPFLLFLAVSGTDLSMLVFFFSGAAGYLLKWLRDDSVKNLLFMSLFISLLPVSVAEGLLYGGLFLLLLAAALFSRNYSLSKKESCLLLASVPLFYLLFIWALFNWFIFGDWLYFVRGLPFHLGRLGLPEGFALSAIFGLFDLFPYIFLIGTVSFLCGTLAGKKNLIYLVLLLAAIPFSIFVQYPGGGHHSLLFLVPAIPVGILMLLEYTGSLRLCKTEKHIMQTRLFLLFLLFISYLFPSPVQIIKREISLQQKANPPSEFTGFTRRLSEENRLIVTGYSGYIAKHYAYRKEDILHIFDLYIEELPFSERPSFLLLQQPERGKERDMIFNRHPGLEAAGEDFTLLEEEVAGWKAYRLITPLGKTIFGDK